MYKFIGDITDSEIILFQEKVRIGKISDLIFDISSAKLLGFFVSQYNSKDIKVVSISDVKGFGNGLVMVNDMNSLSDVDDIVKIKNAVIDNPEIIGSRVETESGQKLGKVANATINLTDYYLEKLYVDPGLSIKFLTNQLIITRNNIIKIKKKTIIVSDEYLRIKSANVASTQAVTGD